MVSNSGAEVSSQALTELQSNLITLSNNLNELYDALHNNKSELSEEWRDEKYNEFAEEFEQTEKAISELSDKYAEWANKYLPPRIESVIEIENANTTLGNNSMFSASPESNDDGFPTGNGTTSASEKGGYRRGIDKIRGKGSDPNADDETTKFSKILFGMKHKIKADGSAHTTYYDGERNTRVSYDTDRNGNVCNLHPTDQNKSKSDPDRHK